MVVFINLNVLFDFKLTSGEPSVSYYCHLCQCNFCGVDTMEKHMQTHSADSNESDEEGVVKKKAKVEVDEFLDR